MPRKSITISVSPEQRVYIDKQVTENGSSLAEEFLNAYTEQHPDFPPNPRKRGAQAGNQNWRGAAADQPSKVSSPP